MSLFHLSSMDPMRPSGFEMIAQSRFIQDLRPALVHALRSLSSQSPTFAFLHHYSNEIFFGLVYMLESHYLREYDGSFAENFYSLKRMREIYKKDGTVIERKLTTNDRKSALFFLSVLPYLKARLDQSYERLVIPHDEEGFQNTHQYDEATEDQWPAHVRLFRKYMYRWYPVMHAVYEGSSFLSMMRYLFANTPFFSPSYLLLQQRVVRMTMDDINGGARSARMSSEPRIPEVHGVLGWVLFLLKRLHNSVAEFAKWGILIGIFSFRFFQWWYSSENDSRRAEDLPIPPPPQPAQPSPNGLVAPEDKTLCAICKGARVNPTFIPSGYVFCYACIFAEVSTNQRCPVTLVPCQTDQLQKIYES